MNTIIVRSENREGLHAFFRMPPGVDPRRPGSPKLAGRYLLPAGKSQLLGVTAQKYRLNDAAIMEDGGELVTFSAMQVVTFPGVFGFEETPGLKAILDQQG